MNRHPRDVRREYRTTQATNPGEYTMDHDATTHTTEITWTILLASKPGQDLIGRDTSSRQSPTGNVRITRIGAVDWYSADAIEDFGGRLPRGASRGAYRVTLYGVPC